MLQVKMVYQIITVWAVCLNDSDVSKGTPGSFFETKASADEKAKGTGWWGGNSPVIARKAIKVDDKVFLLDREEPIDLNETKKKFDEDLKKKTLSSLTPEQIRVLGIKP